MVTIEKILHRGETRIRVEIPNTPEAGQMIRQVPGRLWSRTLRSWHVPYNKESWMILKQLFPDLEVKGTQEKTQNDEGKDREKMTHQNAPEFEPPDTSKSESHVHHQEEREILHLNPNGPVKLQVRSNGIKIFLPKNDQDTAFITALKYYRWLKTEKCWQLPNYAGNLQKLKEYFGQRIHSIEFIKQKQQGTEKRTPDAHTWYCLHKTNGRVLVSAYYNKPLVDFLKKQPYPQYDGLEKTWTVAWHEKLNEEIVNLSTQQGKKLIWETERKDNMGLARPLYKAMQNFRACPESYIAKMKQLNYTPASIKNYVPLFEEFINYYVDTAIDEITPAMIEKYMQYLVVERKLGTSSHRMAISAIKFYYERVLHQTKYTYHFEQPRTESKLPVILNRPEVEKMLALTENLKHKCLLTLAYSCGLRVGEVVGLKPADADLKRATLHIKGGKGMKDRYSYLANKCIPLLAQYLSAYQPKEYLFEGESGGPYSARSAQLVFHQAIERAGINKDLKFHSLRHSFATHALENGTNLRIIQEILGHNSSRTTEIYTHVTQKTLRDFRNPLDDE